MHTRESLIAIGLVSLLVVSVATTRANAGQNGRGASPGDHARSLELRARGLELGYNLDHQEARAAFQQAVAADPSDPAPYRLVAYVTWVNVLFQRGAILVDDYLGQAQSSFAHKPPLPDLDTLFHDQINRSRALADERLRANPRDPDAHFQVGATAGFLATYTATVEGRVVAGLGAARRAYNEHALVLELDPQRKDAGLIVGMYRYSVSALPAPMRLLAHIVGFGGGRERGLRMVEEAAAHPSDVQTDARFVLIVMYSREKRYDDALGVISQLQQRYPRNRLLWLEAASTALRAGRPTQARQAIEEGLAKFATDGRPRAFGEEARWHFYHGAALVASREAELAEHELRVSLAADAPGWLHGRAHKEIGKLADLAGDRTRAVEEYRLALRLCRADNDRVCSEDADQLITTRYRQR